jgi:CDP-glycerol glycerophosphotransferase
MLRTLMRMSKKKAEERQRTSTGAGANNENDDVVASTVSTAPSQVPSDLNTDLQPAGDSLGSPDGSIVEEVTVVITYPATADDLRSIFGGSRIAAGCVCATPSSVSDGAITPVNYSETYTKAPGRNSQMGAFWRFPFLRAEKVLIAEEESFAKRLQILLDHVKTEFIVLSSHAESIHHAGVNELVSRLKNENSPLASGNILHQADTGTHQSPFLASTHKNDHVVDFGDGSAFGDLNLGNKVYKTEFIKEVIDFCVDHNLNEPIQIALTGSAWAEEYPISKEFVLSTTFPTENAAIRRYRNDVDVLATTIGAIEDGIQALEAIGNQELLHAWCVYTIGTLMSPYYQLVPRASEEFWEKLVLFIDRVYRSIEDDGILDEIRLHDRILIHLIKEENRKDCEAVSVGRSDLGSKYSIDVVDGKPLASPNYLSDLDTRVPQNLLQCRDWELQVKAGIFEYRWTSPTILRITGYAYIEGLDAGGSRNRICIRVMDTLSGALLEKPVKQVDIPRIDLLSNDRNRSYRETGFEVDLEISELPSQQLGGSTGSDTWKIEAYVENQGVYAQGVFEWRDRSGAAAYLDLAEIHSGARLVPRFSSSDGLEVKLDRPRYVVDGVKLADRELKLQVRVSGNSIPVDVEAFCAATKTKVRGHLSHYDGNTALYSVQLPKVASDARARGEWEWSIRAKTGGGESYPLAWAYDETALESRVDPALALSARLSGFGYLKLMERRWRILVDRTTMSPDGRYLDVFGSCDLDSARPPRLVLANSRGIVEASFSEVVARSDKVTAEFRARFDTKTQRWGQDGGPIESGAYSLRYMREGVDDPNRSHWVLASRAFSNDLPYNASGHKSRLEITRTKRQGAVKLHFRPNLSDYEASRYGQRELQLEFFTGDTVNLSNKADGQYVVAVCFGGRRVTDTVLEIATQLHEDRPDIPIYWGIVDESVSVPDEFEPIVIGTRRWYELLSNARMLINNNNFPHYFRKRAGQYYLQTWHGTPLKRLVFDVDANNFSLSYWALMAREASYWDLLIGQSEEAAKTLARAFQYKGQLFYNGYPRNDSLDRPESEDRRNIVRDYLGIGYDKKVALYAPTWRDNAKSSSSQYAMVTYLDFDAFNEKLGDEWTILLRGHHNIAAGRQTSGLNVIDVTDYPLVNDLYLAADALVTDYSSVMFDFSVTGKQIVFLAPDIDAYGGSIRGFYFDLVEAAPGPVVKTTRGVIDALQNLTLTQWRYLRKRKEFRRRFAPHDDGLATRRLYEVLPLERIFSQA